MRHAAPPPPRPASQQGTVALIVALAMAALLGMLALVLDSGQLYISKTEMQGAADACALAAARELVCDGTSDACLLNARAAGRFVARQNKAGLQRTAVAVPDAGITFSSSLGGSYSAGGPNQARFVRCTADASVAPWLMGLFGAGASRVAATAVGTPSPAQTFCLSTPMALCTASGSGPDHGLSAAAWVAATSNGSEAGDTLTGGMRWATLSGDTDATAISDQMAGATPVCGLATGRSILLPSGAQPGAKAAYNTRFGLYLGGASAYKAANAPPDLTGYAYPTSAIALDSSAAFTDYLGRSAAHTPFMRPAPDYTGTAAGDALSAAEHQARGTTGRRLVAVPFVDCGASPATIQGTACVLLLNPMASGNGSSTLHFQYLGNASASGTACGSYGQPGGTGSDGPLVPTLAQ